MRVAQLAGKVSRLPSDYFGRNVFIGASTMSREEVRRRYAIGIDTVMWGNDYPHPEGTWPHTVAKLKETFHDVPVADVVGHDWGANVAWTLAAWHPDRVRTLTAVSVPHPAAYTVAYRADPEQKERSAYIRLFWQEGKAEEVLLADDARRLRRMLTGGEGETGVHPESVDEYVAVLSAPGALTAALNWYRAMSSDVRVDPVGVPTTYVWSDGDVAIGRTAAEACANYVTGDYRFVELPGVTHWIPEQAPDQLASAILERVAAG